MLNFLLSTDLCPEVGESMGFDFSSGKDREKAMVLTAVLLPGNPTDGGAW